MKLTKKEIENKRLHLALDYVISENDRLFKKNNNKTIEDEDKIDEYNIILDGLERIKEDNTTKCEECGEYFLDEEMSTLGFTDDSLYCNDCYDYLRSEEKFNN